MKNKKIVVFIAAAAIFTLVFSGCAAKPEETAQPVKEETGAPAKEYSLQEILNDSQGKLTEEDYAGLFAGDVFLSELGLRKTGAAVEEDTLAPTVMILNPKKNETISEIKVISVFALDDVGIEKVEFYIDGELDSTDSQLPYSYYWDTLSDDQKYANGTHTIRVVGYDEAGNTGSDSRNVKVLNIQKLTLSKDGSQFSSKSGNVTAKNRFYDKDDEAYYNIAHVGTYDNSAWVEYVFQLPYPHRYFYLNFNVTTKRIAGGDPTYYFYDWALDTWVHLTGSASSSELNFWACQPYFNKVKIAVSVPKWSIAQIRKVDVGYRFLPDKDTPVITDISAISTAPVSATGFNWVSFVFKTSEDVFIDINIRRTDGSFIRDLKAAWRAYPVDWSSIDFERWTNKYIITRPTGETKYTDQPLAWYYGYCFVPWNCLDSNETKVPVGTYKFRVNVKDTAGHSRTSSWYNFSVGPPTIEHSPSSFTFTASATSGAANPPAQILKIWSSGWGRLTWSISDNAPWLFLFPTSGSEINHYDAPIEVQVFVDKTGLPAGTYPGRITITGVGATNSPRTIDTTLTLTP